MCSPTLDCQHLNPTDNLNPKNNFYLFTTTAPPQTGDLLALKQDMDTECLAAPCLLGDTAVLGDELPQCRSRPYTLRAVSDVTGWELPLRDMQMLLVVHYTLKEKMMESMKQVSRSCPGCSCCPPPLTLSALLLRRPCTAVSCTVVFP